jgi:uncharacterized phiE125 gp8 family phage protein
MANIQSPVTLDEAKTHLRVVHTDDDIYITALLLAATKWAEDFQCRTYVSRTHTDYLDEWPSGTPSVIEPIYSPLVSTGITIKYIDTDGVEQSLSSTYYRVDANSEPGRITEAYGYSWPDIRNVTNAINITYTAGYGKAAAVPDDVKAAIKLIVGHLYEHREMVSEVKLDMVPFSAKELLWTDRLVKL